MNFIEFKCILAYNVVKGGRIMLEFFEYSEVDGIASIYESHITLNKIMLKFLKDAYRVRVEVNKEEGKIYIYPINKDYALSGQISENSLLKISLASTYARVCSRPLIEYLSKIFNLTIEAKKYKRYKAIYDESKKAIMIFMKEEIS